MIDTMQASYKIQCMKRYCVYHLLKTFIVLVNVAECSHFLLNMIGVILIHSYRHKH